MLVGDKTVQSVERFMCNMELSSPSHRITFTDGDTLDRFCSGEIGKKEYNGFSYSINKAPHVIAFQAQQVVDAFRESKQTIVKEN